MLDANSDILFTRNAVDRLRISTTITPLSSIDSYSVQNILINGSFQVWQRYPSIAVPASTTAYTCDRWQLQTGANQASVVSRQTGGTVGDFYCRVLRNSGQTGTGTMFFASSLGRSNTYMAAGKVVTLSFLARSGATFSPTSGTLTATLVSGTGSTDISVLTGFVGGTNVINFNSNLTTGMTRYTATSSAVVPSNCTQLGVRFSWTPTLTAGANDWFELGSVQLDIAPFAGAIRMNSYDEELARCKVFYQKISCVASYSISVNNTQHSLTIPVQMRGIPTLNTIDVNGSVSVPLIVTNGLANFAQTSLGTITSYLTDGNGGLFALANFSGLTALQPLTLSNHSSNQSVITCFAELI